LTLAEARTLMKLATVPLTFAAEIKYPTPALPEIFAVTPLKVLLVTVALLLIVVELMVVIFAAAPLKLSAKTLAHLIVLEPKS